MKRICSPRVQARRGRRDFAIAHAPAPTSDSSVDAQLEDFTDKKLGNGDIYYGERKSNIYGKDAKPSSGVRAGAQYQGRGISDRRKIEEQLSRERAGKSQDEE